MKKAPSVRNTTLLLGLLALAVGRPQPRRRAAGCGTTV